MRLPPLKVVLLLLLVLLGVGAGSRAAHAPRVETSAQENPVVVVVFMGDIMLDRNVARHAEAVGVRSLFRGVKAAVSDADLRVANLEGTITTNPSIAQRDNQILRFTFEPALAEQALAHLGVNAVSLANNHALDFGAEGYEQTRAYLSAWGISSFGHPQNIAGTLSAQLSVRGRTLCFVGYHELYDPELSSVLEEIHAIRQDCWRVIAFSHWGEEYKPEPNSAQRAEARALVNAGADVVVGAHPHVVEPHEVYRGVAIFYSLGNFMFDQNFSEETMLGRMVRAEFYSDKTRFSIIPIRIAGQEASVSDGAVDTFVLP